MEDTIATSYRYASGGKKPDEWKPEVPPNHAQANKQLHAWSRSTSKDRQLHVCETIRKLTKGVFFLEKLRWEMRNKGSLERDGQAGCVH